MATNVPEFCPECKQPTILVGEWHYEKQSELPPGAGARHTLQDVRVVFILGCDECSATILIVPAKRIADHLTNSQVRYLL